MVSFISSFRRTTKNASRPVSALISAAAFAAALGFAAPHRAQAAPITYTFTGTGSGSLGSTSFTNANFVVSLVADTANIDTTTFGPSTPSVLVTSSMISITGLSPATITEQLRVFNNKSSQIAGFTATSGFDRYDVSSSALSNYNLDTNFGPITGDLLGSDLIDLATNSGTLNLTASNPTSTFQAVTNAAAAPEPGTLPLVGMGIVSGLGVVRGVRRRKAGKTAA